jgi:hypothetical protein
MNQILCIISQQCVIYCIKLHYRSFHETKSTGIPKSTESTEIPKSTKSTNIPECVLLGVLQ